MNKRGLFALALGTFALGITEYLTMGILGMLAADMDVSISGAGVFHLGLRRGECVWALLLCCLRERWL